MSMQRSLPVEIDIDKILSMTESGKTLTAEQVAERKEEQAARKARVLARLGRYNDKHRAEINAAMRKYYAEHREEMRRRYREYYAANIEKKRAQARERSRRYYERHREEVNERLRERRRSKRNEAPGGETE